MFPYSYYPKKARSSYIALSMLELLMVLAIVGSIMGLSWASLKVWGHPRKLDMACQQLISYLHLAKEYAASSNVEAHKIRVVLNVEQDKPIRVCMLQHNTYSDQWSMLDKGWGMPVHICVQSKYYKDNSITEFKTLQSMFDMLENIEYIIEFNSEGALSDNKAYTLLLWDNHAHKTIFVSPLGHITEN